MVLRYDFKSISSLHNSRKEELKSYNIVIFGEAPKEIDFNKDSYNIIWLTKDLNPALSLVPDDINIKKVCGVKYNSETLNYYNPKENPEF